MTETSQPEKQDPQNVYELMENDDGEVMVLFLPGKELRRIRLLPWTKQTG